MRQHAKVSRAAAESRDVTKRQKFASESEKAADVQPHSRSPVFPLSHVRPLALLIRLASRCFGGEWEAVWRVAEKFKDMPSVKDFKRK